MMKMVIHSSIENMKRIESKIAKSLEGVHLGDRTVCGLRLVIEEALYNDVKHGDRYDEKNGIAVSWDINGDIVSIRIADEGGGSQ